MNRRRKAVWVFLPLALLAGLGGWCLYCMVDEPPPEDSDLRAAALGPGEVPPEENGFVLLEGIEEVEWPEEPEEARGGDDEDSDPPVLRFLEMTAGKTWDPELVEKALALNRETLENFDRAMERPHFRFPPGARMDRRLDIGVCRGITNLVLLRHRKLLREGNESSALEEALKLVRFGHRIEGGSGGLVQVMVGSWIKLIGLERVRGHIPRLDDEALETCLRELEALPASVEGLEQAYRSEYLVQEELIDGAAETELKDVPPTLIPQARGPARLMPWKAMFHPNRTRRLFAEAMRSMASLPAKTLKEAQALDPAAHVSANPWIPSRNVVGKLIFIEIMDAEMAVLMIVYRERLQIAGTRLLLALKRHQLAQGTLPGSLEELVPRFLAELPRDPWDGSSFGYSPSEKRISFSPPPRRPRRGLPDPFIAAFLPDPDAGAPPPRPVEDSFPIDF